jgi:EAL domain-containing protein (putative c-di-GMP-specific phosphodiesterase class I)/GGDEF domain-containing protein
MEIGTDFMETLSKLPSGWLDPITYLPNRRQFNTDYKPVPGVQLVMMTLSNAKHFTQLVRAIGHEYSEDFMRAGAARLREALPSGCIIYHVSILSFAFLLPDGAPPELLRKIIDQFSQPLVCGRIPIMTDIALGIADCTDASPAFVLRASLAAAQDSRDSGRDWARYNPKTDTAHQRGFLLLSQLTNAMQADDQLTLHFQPKYAMASGHPTSAEALLRWKHPIFGAISPAEFVPLAEATAHIHPLTDWVLRHAIAQAGAWAAKGMELNIAINISPRNLTRRGFAKRIAEILKLHGVSPSSIELEFTEGVLVSNDHIVLHELQALRDTGIRIALDDFGTGFANFSYITHLPADIIKIDKSFIQKISSDERSALVVRTLIELAHRLDYSVVAEGIETEKVYSLLASWNCDEGQGFYMSPPLDAARFAEKINFKKSVVSSVTISNLHREVNSVLG